MSVMWILSVESSASAVSQSSKSDGTEQQHQHQLSITVNNDDVISLSSLDHTSLLGDVTDAKQRDDARSTDRTESPVSEHVLQVTSEHVPSSEHLPTSEHVLPVTSEHLPASQHAPISVHMPMSEHLPTSEYMPAGRSVDIHQHIDSDIYEEPASLSNGDEPSCITVDAHSQQLSDVRRQSAVNVDVSSTKRPSLTPSSILSHTDQSTTDHSVISSSLKNISQNEDQGLVYIVFSKPYNVHHVQEKVVHLIFSHIFCKCRPIFKILSLADSQGTLYFLS